MAHFTNIKAIAFDLDGTLVDSAPGLARTVDNTLVEMGFSAPGVERVSTWIGNGADIMLTRALRWALNAEPDVALLKKAHNIFDLYYAHNAEQGSTLFPGVEQSLRTLHQQGLPLALVTNKPSPFIVPLLTALDIAEYFSLIIGADDVVAKKPHPSPLFLVLGKFGLLPKELLFVGDSRNDIQAAKAAGCPSAGMTFGYNYGEPLADSQPDLLLDTFTQLLPALGL